VTTETQKLITISYNLLNLPYELNWLGQNKYVRYFYTFDGEKLRKTVENNGTVTKVDYCGPFIYETVSGVRSLKYIVTPEGRAVKSGSDWVYEYNLTDHLGNVRAVIRKGSNGLAELIQQKHYYPFGMEMSQLNLGTGTNKYLYNSKEIQDDFNLYWYDYGARFYDPGLGRWHVIDPMTEKYYNLTPYAYVLNNPISKMDIYGLTDWDAVKQGSIAIIGGLLSTVGGISATLTPTGVGQIAGAILIPTGIATMGGGTVKVIAGIIDNGTADKVPTGMGELTGMVGDAIFGNENGELRKVGVATDFISNLAGGGPTTAIEALVIGAQAVSTGEQVFDKNAQSSGTSNNKDAQTLKVGEINPVGGNLNKEAIKIKLFNHKKEESGSVPKQN
jgi:RHS repeat-associated protein